jgi:Fic family protein
MEPTIPSGDGRLEDQAKELVGKSACLGGMLHPKTRDAVIDLLRLINSYYSNLIEGNNTEPAEIEKAMQRDYSQDPAKRNLQMESLAHIHVQREMEKKLAENPDLDPSDRDFLCWIHEVFYERIPEELHWVVNDERGERVRVIGGEIRQREVHVGQHYPPNSQELERFLRRFFEVYQRGRHHGIKPIIVAAAAHHRLLWIHPFMDGNGRVARLYTDASLRLNLDGYGLWNVSRGFARNAATYRASLSMADAQRRNDLDGRGNLSNEGLLAFCRFFLDICHDQVDYMEELLQLDGIINRIRGYVRLRVERMIPSPGGQHRGMKPEAAKMIEAVLLRGQLTRGEVAEAAGSHRTGRDILPQLVEEGILVSDMPKGPVRLAFPTHIAGYLFPDLYPNRLPLR